MRVASPLIPLLALFVPAATAAQSAGGPQRAANSITPGDIARRIGIIAHDSMRGRDTPSPELEQVAAYIAEEFRRFGLRPGGDSGTFIQRYGIVQRAIDTAATELRVAGRRAAVFRAGSTLNVLRFPGLPMAKRELSGPVVVLAGEPGGEDLLAGADVGGAWVALVLTATPQGGVPLDFRTIQAALRSGAVGVLLITDRPEIPWRDRMAQIQTPTTALEGVELPDTALVPALVEIRDQSAAALGVDLAAARGAPARTAHRLEGVIATFRARERVVSRVTAPNVVGILEGSDARLKREYVLYSAHMDHVGVAGPGGTGGCQARGADSICNGADDDASGTVAVVEAAEALARVVPRPRRSIVFLTVSGEEKGLWGSAFFAEHPPVRLDDVVAALNLDMVGRNWRDTIAAIGREHSDLGTTLDRIAAAHPELNMRPVADQWPAENFYFRSDHYNFARKGVPILFFFNGTHPDYHEVSDHPDRIDAEKASRIVQLVFYLGLEIANAPDRPRWHPDSYRRIVSGR